MKKFLIVLCVLAVCSIALAEKQRPRQQRQARSPRIQVLDSNAPVEEEKQQDVWGPICQQSHKEKQVEEQKAQEPKKEKPDNRSVIVDAWLVQVSADALYESGVKPLSEKDKENVSIMNLLWCLGDPNNGKVVVSATTCAAVREEVRNTFRNEIYLSESTESFVGPNSKPIVSRTQHPYVQSVDFQTRSSVLENKQVRVEWSFRSDFIYSKIKDKYPPDKGSVGYENITVVSAQKPVIVAQTQIGDDMFFLVLRAEIID